MVNECKSIVVSEPEYWNDGLGKPGILDCWNTGIMGKTFLFNPIFHYSAIPKFFL
jgi:hypothetical protein